MSARSSFFIKMLTYMLLISAVPLLFLGVYAFVRSTTAVQTKADEANIHMLQQSQSRVEQILKVIDQVAARFTETPLVAGSVNRQLTVDDFQEIDQLGKGMLGVQTYELGVKSVELHSIEHDWYIKDGGFYVGRGSSKRMPAPDNGTLTRWVFETAAEGFTGIRLEKSIPAGSPDPKGYLFVRVSSHELASLLTGGFPGRETMILDANFNIIVHSDEQRIGQPVSAEPWSSEFPLANDETYDQHGVLQGKRYSVIYNQSRYNNWTYVSAIPLEEARKESASIGWATLTACLILLLSAGLLSYWGSRRMYFPVRNLIAVTMQISRPAEGKAPVKDELQWIGRHLEDLHRSKEKLEGQMKIQSGQLIDYFMLRLFQGELYRSEAEEKASQLAIPEWPRYAVMLLQIDTFADTRYSPGEQDLLLFAINNIASELIPAPRRVHAMPIGNYQVTLLGSDAATPEGMAFELKEQAARVQQAVAEFLGLNVSVGISRSHPQIYAAYQALLEAKEALQYRLRLGERAILHLDDWAKGHTARHFYPHHLVSEMTKAIALLDGDQAEQLLRQFIQEVLRIEADPNLYRVSFAMLLTDLARFIYEAGGSEEVLFHDRSSGYEQLFRLKTAEEIEDWFRMQIFAPLLEWTRRRRESPGQSISRSVMDMIHEHFDSELTLEQISQKLNYSPHYIRRIFRQETGRSFSDYLSSYRHDMAKRWLAGTELKITEIAERLQYTNAQNFIRQFRRLEGTTPGQYREQHRRQE